MVSRVKVLRTTKECEGELNVLKLTNRYKELSVSLSYRTESSPQNNNNGRREAVMSLTHHLIKRIPRHREYPKLCPIHLEFRVIPVSQDSCLRGLTEGSEGVMSVCFSKTRNDSVVNDIVSENCHVGVENCVSV